MIEGPKVARWAKRGQVEKAGGILIGLSAKAYLSGDTRARWLPSGG